MIIRFFCKEGVSAEDIHPSLRRNRENAATVRGVFNNGASIFGKEAKAHTTRCDVADRESSSVMSEFSH
jgi:hypothetical protein